MDQSKGLKAPEKACECAVLRCDVYCVVYRRPSDRRRLLRTADSIESVRGEGLGRVQGRGGSDCMCTRWRTVRFLQ